ncbi:hypothetical protein [Methanolobus halotolerans]|uniref:Uncharacterized protein n=1 Tax=Methanolobus halotolerans TaxID=2052935 RepID=A0A4E0Q9C9_9EURY|nr:hypothetical protein [Methanolobus halotolerans]TGC11520.1 hypothetical protein CUN85_01235 [Methanolobus halotolerans]
MYKRYLQLDLNKKEFEIRLGSLIAGLRPQLKRRAVSYGMDGKCIDVLLADIQEDLLFQFERWTDDEYLAFVKMICKTMLDDKGSEHRVKSPGVVESMQEVDSLNGPLTGRLILNMLENRCSLKEREMLKLLRRSEASLGSTHGHSNSASYANGLYQTSSGRIKILLMDGSAWGDIRSILQHEFTHFFTHESCFNTIIKAWHVPQSTYLSEDELEDILINNVRSVVLHLYTGKALKMEEVEQFLRWKIPVEIKPSAENLFKKTVCEESINSVVFCMDDIAELDIMKDDLMVRNMTFSLCNILDESLAYLSEKYTGLTYDAGKLAVTHSTTANIRDFEKIYRSLERITANMNEEDFDTFAKCLCDRFLSIWDPFWGIKEYEAAVDSILDVRVCVPDKCTIKDKTH